MLICEGLRKRLKFLGYFPIDLRIPQKYEKYLKFLRKIPIQRIQNCLVFGMLVQYNFQILIFSVFKATNPNEYRESVFFVSLSLTMSSVYTILVWKKPQILRHISEFEELLEQRCTSRRAKLIYQEAQSRIIKITYLYYEVMFNSFIASFFFVHILIALYNHITSEDPNESFGRLPIPTWLPFEYTTPMGHFVGFVLQTIGFLVGADASIGVFVTFYAFCQILVAFTEDLLETIQDFNLNLEILPKPLSIESATRLEQNLCEIAQFHATAKRLALDFAHTYRSIVFTYLAYAGASITISMLEIQEALEENNWKIIVRYIVFMDCGSIWLYSLCNVGQEVTTQFQSIGDALYKFSWHKLPLKLRKYLPKMIMVAQRPVYVQGMGDIRCTRETFKMVVKAGFTYFVVIRQSLEQQMRLYRLYRNFKSGPATF